MGRLGLLVATWAGRMGGTAPRVSARDRIFAPRALHGASLVTITRPVLMPLRWVWGWRGRRLTAGACWGGAWGRFASMMAMLCSAIRDFPRGSSLRAGARPPAPSSRGRAGCPRRLVQRNPAIDGRLGSRRSVLMPGAGHTRPQFSVLGLGPFPLMAPPPSWLQCCGLGSGRLTLGLGRDRRRRHRWITHGALRGGFRGALRSTDDWTEGGSESWFDLDPTSWQQLCCGLGSGHILLWPGRDCWHRHRGFTHGTFGGGFGGAQ